MEMAPPFRSPTESNSISAVTPSYRVWPMAGRELGGFDRVGTLHRVGRDHHRHRRHTGVELDFGIELLGEFRRNSGPLASFPAACPAGAEIAFARLAAQLHEFRRTAPSPPRNLALMPSSFICFGHRSALGVHAAEEDQFGLGGLDLGQDGLEVGGLVVGYSVATTFRPDASAAFLNSSARPWP